MSTFLELAVKTRQNCLIPGTGPTSVLNQTGELKNIVDWVADAYKDIQNRHNNWRWMQHNFTLQTTASKDSYAFTEVTDATTSAVIARFDHWILDDYRSPPKVFLTSATVGTERWFSWLPWQEFELIYKIGQQNDGLPAFITVDPQDNFVMGPAPNDIYTVSGNFQRSAQILAADADVPEMPVQFHDAIMYRAMEKYAYMESAQEVLIRAQTEGRRIMRSLEKNQLGKVRLASPLA